MKYTSQQLHSQYKDMEKAKALGKRYGGSDRERAVKEEITYWKMKAGERVDYYGRDSK